MPHTHSHSAPTRTLLIAFGLTLIFVVFELLSGIVAHSLALVSDAGHNFADALALLLAYGAARVAQSPATSSRTFGYHRATILAALFNALALIAIAFYIFWEAYRRLGVHQDVNSHLMIVVALSALVLNTAISFLLRKETHDLNLRSAYVHMLGDAVASMGVIVAGVVILFAGAYWVDPLTSVLIGFFILWTSWSVVREGVNILLEAAPAGLDMKQVEEAIRGVAGVLATHDLHVWTISSGMLACSCHAVISRKTVEDGQQIIKNIVRELKTRFQIGHTTIQIEIEGCDPNDLYCGVKEVHDH